MEGRMAATFPHSTSRLSTYVLTSTPQIVSSPHLSLTVRFDHRLLKFLGIFLLAFCVIPEDSQIG